MLDGSISAATASGHLRRLIDHQLVVVDRDGPTRRVRLARPLPLRLPLPLTAAATASATATASAAAAAHR